jgi:hypothetical protein
MMVARMAIPPGLFVALLDGFDVVAMRNSFTECAELLRIEAPQAKGQATALMNSIDQALTDRNGVGYDNGNPEHRALARGLDMEFGALRAIVAELRVHTNGPRADLQWETAINIRDRLTRIVHATGGV